MTRTQVQIPDHLYGLAKRVADRREISLAELVRRGLEYMVAVSAKDDVDAQAWELPPARSLGGNEPFSQPEWRADLHLSRLKVAESAAKYAAKPRRGGRS